MGAQFELWITANGGDDGTIRSSLSTVRRVESAYGDLDDLYDHDRCQSVLTELTYTKNDARIGAPNPSKIGINGDLYSGLASLRTHLTEYIRFRDELGDTTVPTAAEPAPLGSTDATFSLERDLQAALRSAIEQLEPGLEIIDGGGEYASAIRPHRHPRQGFERCSSRRRVEGRESHP